MITITKVSEEYVGNGVQTIFDYRFKIFHSDHLFISINGIGANAVITGAGNDLGGTIEFPVAPISGAIVFMQRESPAVQETDYKPNEPFKVESHEEALDYNVAIIQELRARLSSPIVKGDPGAPGAQGDPGEDGDDGLDASEQPDGSIELVKLAIGAANTNIANNDTGVPSLDGGLGFHPTQTWTEYIKDVPNERFEGVEYTNETGRDIQVSITARKDTTGYLIFKVNGQPAGRIPHTSLNFGVPLCVTVRNNDAYELEPGAIFTSWSELS